MQDEKKTELTGMTCGEITEWVREAGMPAFRGKQIFQWIHRGADFDGMSNLPKDLRERLKETAVAQPVPYGCTGPADWTGRSSFSMR